MCGVVISIGISVWGYAHSTTSIMSNDYYEDVMESVYNIKERFFIENVCVNISSPKPSLQVWVTNYGSNDINITMITIQGSGKSYTYYPPDNDEETPPNGLSISPGELTKFDINQDTVQLWSGLSISVRVNSERVNKAYARIWIP